MIFGRALDNLLRAATITVSTGTPLSGYDVENLCNEIWSYPFKVSETTLDLRIDLGSALQVAWPVLGNSNLNVAARLQGHSDTATWAGTTLVDRTFAIPTQSVDGFFTSPHLDLSSETPCRYWRLTVTGNALPIIIGELYFGPQRRSIESCYLFEDAEPSSAGRSVQHLTPFDIDLGYEQGTRREVIDGSVIVTATELAEVENMIRSSRFGVRAFFCLPYDDSADAWFVRYMGGDTLKKKPLVTGPDPDMTLVALPIREVSRGLPWVDPDA